MADAVLQPLLNFLKRSSSASNQSSEVEAPPSSEIGAKFAALKKKFGTSLARSSGTFHGKNGKGGKVGKGAGSAHTLRVVDSLSGSRSSGGPLVLVSKPNNPDGVAMLLRDLMKSSQTSTLTAVCILASHKMVQSHTKLGEMVSGGEASGWFYIVVPAAQPDLVWYCGKFESPRLYTGGSRALIDAAVAAKKAGQDFAKLAKSFERLGELVGDANGSSGGGKSRMEHLFSKTDPAVRAKLMMDATATFSVTDEVTADQITEHCLHLPGMYHGSTLMAAAVDLTACIGGNTLSFAKYFDQVVAVECDEPRFKMLGERIHAHTFLFVRFLFPL